MYKCAASIKFISPVIEPSRSRCSQPEWFTTCCSSSSSSSSSWTSSSASSSTPSPTWGARSRGRRRSWRRPVSSAVRVQMQEDSEMTTAAHSDAAMLNKSVVLQGWRETSSTTRRCRLRSTSSRSTACGTTFTSWFWWGWRIRQSTRALRATWPRWLRSVASSSLTVARRLS